MQTEEIVSTAKGAAIAAGFLAFMTVMAFSIADIFPQWIAQTMWVAVVTVWIVGFCKLILHRLNPRERRWYFAGTGVIVAVVSVVLWFLSDSYDKWREIVFVLFQGVIILLVPYQLIYVLATKKRVENYKK